MQLNLYPSKYFLAFILLCHVTVMLIILALPIKWWAMVIIESLLAGSFVHMVQKYITRKSEKNIVSLWKDDNNWILMNRVGDRFTAALQKDTSSSSLLVVLRFKLANGKTESVLVFPDSIDKNTFRKLRVYLKTGKF